MRIANCVKILPFLALFCAVSITTSFADPVVSNVRAQQRPGTGLVDIYYDLTGTVEAAEVTVEGSDDAGATFLHSYSVTSHF